MTGDVFSKRIWRRVKPIKARYLFAAFLAVAVVCAFALRSNNLTMVKLRNDVFTADKENGDVVAALQRLRQYVGTHMNTDLSSAGGGVYPPIQLKETYDRLKAAEQARISQINNSIYSDAQAHCERLYPSSFTGGPRIPCIQQYVSERGITQPKVIPDALYKFDFVSARWSPDLAGWTIVLSVVLFTLALVRFTFGRWVAPRL